MSETKHTPTEGPWVVVPNPRGHRDVTTIFCGFDNMEDFDRDKHAWIEVYGANQEANAAFLEQAPTLLEQRDELLEAALGAEQSLADFIGVYGDNGAGEVLAELRTAIAKAKGRRE